jgi:beta-phosphoglucomutase-like phosphatase (HAD superfamily)
VRHDKAFLFDLDGTLVDSVAFLCFLCMPAVFLFKRVRAKKGPVAMH